MQLILDTEPSVDISMAELKDSIREKLVNDIKQDLICSANKENVEQLDNVICNGTNGDNEKIFDDQEPIVDEKEKCSEQKNLNGSESEYNSTVRNIDEDIVECSNYETNLESQSIDDSTNFSKTNNDMVQQPMTESNLDPKQGIQQDFIPEEENKAADVTIPSLEMDIVSIDDDNVLENKQINPPVNDLVINIDMEDVQCVDKKLERETNVKQSECINNFENKDSCDIKESITIDESEMDVIEIQQEEAPVPSPTKTSSSSIENTTKLETVNLLDNNKLSAEETKIENDDTAKLKDAKLESVIIDDNDQDSSVAEIVDSMETNVDESVESITKSITVNVKEDEKNSVTEKSVVDVATCDSLNETKDDIVVVDEEMKDATTDKTTSTPVIEEKKIELPLIKRNNSICRLSNTLNILSDDEEDSPKEEAPKTEPPKDPQKVETVTTDKQCIDIEDDDDIMFVEEDKNEQKKTEEIKETLPEPNKTVENDTSKVDEETGEKKSSFMESIELVSNKTDKEPTAPVTEATEETQLNEKTEESKVEKVEEEKPLLPENLLSLSKKKLSDMTRGDLEEFCILKIVESIMDRSQLSDIKAKLKTMSQNFDEYRKKAAMLTKQNRALQVVLKSVQEEQKKINETYNVIAPLKITRSVGMQVLMPDKNNAKRKNNNNSNNNTQNITHNNRAKTPSQPPRPQKPATAQSIPVPRLVPASNTLRSPTTNATNALNVGKSPTTIPNGVKNPPIQKAAEKRPFNKVTAVTVDLTDDEPPAKIPQRCSPIPPVRVVPSQNLMANPRHHNAMNQLANSPRKVFIPIGAQNPANRPGQGGIMLKTVSPHGPKLRTPGPNIIRPPNQVRMRASSLNRHPAPLPDATKQYQPPNWKALPPAPDLKLSKVENGIVISWKIDGYQEDLYEQIASYQLYAYQETSSPPSTALWKKIGDVKALPLPMACTLTQFTAGFKYFFAVRAVDVRSRLGPFSLPGSILLLQKM